jgi:hypothetical protein
VTERAKFVTAFVSNNRALARTITANEPEKIHHPDDVQHLVKTFKEMDEELTRVQEVLQDPHAVYLNILRGTIVLPSNETQLALLKAMAEELTEARAVIDHTRPAVVMCSAGAATPEQKEIARASDEYKQGDMILQWVNEGDVFSQHLSANVKKRFLEKYPRR